MWNIKEMDNEELRMIAENFRVGKLTGKILLYLEERKSCPDSWNELLREGIPEDLDIDTGDWEEAKVIVEDLRERELILEDLFTHEEVYEDDFEDASSTSSLSHRSTSTTSSMEYGVLRVPTAFFPHVTPNKTCLKTPAQASTMGKNSTTKFTMVNTKEFYVSKREKTMKSKACPPEQAEKNREEYYGPSIDLSNTDDLDRLVASNLKFKRVKPENRIHDNDEIASSNFAHIIKDVDKTARISKRGAEDRIHGYYEVQNTKQSDISTTATDTRSQDDSSHKRETPTDDAGFRGDGVLEQRADAPHEKVSSTSSSTTVTSEDCVPLMFNEEIIESLEMVGKPKNSPQQKSKSVDSFSRSNSRNMRVSGEPVCHKVESAPVLAQQPLTCNSQKARKNGATALTRSLYRPVKSSHALIQATRHHSKASPRHVTRTTIGQSFPNGRAVNRVGIGFPNDGFPDVEQPRPVIGHAFSSGGAVDRVGIGSPKGGFPDVEEERRILVPQPSDGSQSILPTVKSTQGCRVILVQSAPGSEMDSCSDDKEPVNRSGNEGEDSKRDVSLSNSTTRHESSEGSDVTQNRGGRSSRVKAFLQRKVRRIKDLLMACNCIR